MTWTYLDDNLELCTYSPEQVAASSQTCCSDTYPSALSRLMPTAAEYLSPVSATDGYRDSRYGMTLRRSEGTSGADGLMWYAGDSPVRTYLPPEGVSGYEGSEADCGPSSPESLAKYNPDTYSWKTRQCSLLGGLISYSETWPRWGSMRDGELYPQQTPVLRTSESESGYLPTPGAADNRARGHILMPSIQRRIRIGKQIGLSMLFEGNPCPLCVEGMMGWPKGWSLLAPLATAKFPKPLRSRGASLAWSPE